MIDDQSVITEYENQPFDLIERRLNSTKAHLMDAPIPVTATALRLSTINSIISLNTHVTAHECGTIDAWETIQNGNSDEQSLSNALDRASPNGKHHIMYYNQKAGWIHENLISVDYTELAELFQEDDMMELQGALLDEVKGLGSPKAAFTIANLGMTDAACIDSVMHGAFEETIEQFDAIHPFETAVTELYYERVDDLQSKTPEASEQMDRYIWQWATWSAARGSGFSAHDSWFLILDTVLDVDVFEPPARPLKNYK